MAQSFLGHLAERWWVLLIRGIAAIVFGLIALLWPALTAWALLITFGVFAIVDGVFAAVDAYSRRKADDRWGWMLLEGILSIAIGIMAIAWPVASAIAITLWIGAWAVIVGGLRIYYAIKLRREMTGEWALGLSGLLLIVWGIILFALPVAGFISLAWVFGAFSLAAGVALVILSFRLKGHKGGV